MVVTVSSETRAVPSSTCCASVRTADSTSLFARSLLGRNSFCSNAEKSSFSSTSPCSCAAVFCFLAIGLVLLVIGAVIAGCIRCGRERLEQFGIIDRVGHQLLGA